MTTAASVGFVLFLVVPILGYSNLLAIPVHEYSMFVMLAYFSFLVGASMARRLLGEQTTFDIVPSPSGAQANFAAVFCVVWLAILLMEFFVKGGFARIEDVFLGGWAHMQVLAQIGELMQYYQGLSPLAMAKILFNNMFWCFWVVLYIKMPKRALIVWVTYVLVNLSDYMARSTLLGLVLVPVLTYLTVNRPSPIRVAMLTTILLTVTLVFFSWEASVRLGLPANLSREQIFSDMMRDAGNSAIPATMVLSQNIRGDLENYFLTMATFLIPRSIWKDKPLEQYNYGITYQLTGLIVGQGTSVKTSTMLGEAWYYFGWSGAIWLMLLFGLSAYIYENLLGRNVYSLGLFFKIFYLTIIYIRSTFLTYFQTGSIAILSALVVVWLVHMLDRKRDHLQHTSATRRAVESG